SAGGVCAMTVAVRSAAANKRTSIRKCTLGESLRATSVSCRSPRASRLRFSVSVECRVEQHAEGAERLTAPLRTEPQQHNVAVAERDVERGSLSVQVLL